MEDIFEELAAVVSDEEERVEERNQPAGDDEAQEVDENRRVVKPKRTISRPRPKLDPARLLGPRGIFVVTSTFDGIKFKGKGHELDDLNNVLSRLQHWAHRLFPKMTFEDCIDRIEELGNKREIQTNMHKIRMGMIDLDGQTNQADDEAIDDPPPLSPTPAVNPFDQLIAAAPPQPSTLTDEQRARMMRNRLLAEERRMARRLAREKELDEQRMVVHDSAQNATSVMATSGSPSSGLEEQRRNLLDPVQNDGPSLMENGSNSSSSLCQSAQLNIATPSIISATQNNSDLSAMEGRSLSCLEDAARVTLDNPSESADLNIEISSDSSPRTDRVMAVSLSNDSLQAVGVVCPEAEGVITNPIDPSKSCTMETDG